MYHSELCSSVRKLNLPQKTSHDECDDKSDESGTWHWLPVRPLAPARSVTHGAQGPTLSELHQSSLALGLSLRQRCRRDVRKRTRLALATRTFTRTCIETRLRRLSSLHRVVYGPRTYHDIYPCWWVRLPERQGVVSLFLAQKPLNECTGDFARVDETRTPEQIAMARRLDREVRGTAHTVHDGVRCSHLTGGGEEAAGARGAPQEGRRSAATRCRAQAAAHK